MFDRDCTAEDFVLHYDNALAHLNDLTDVLDEVARFGLHFVTWLKVIGLSSQ
ncbi:MAG TPA: hypothetical protein VFP42_09060 [Acidimicrobiia bacterium]|nr:hypothetical protein [Acidimicrobiia bacterium]